MIILGIDPGTATTGFGIIKKTPKNKKPINGFGFEHLIHGVIKTTTDHSAANRLNKIHIELNKILKAHQPTIVAVESIFFFKNLKTALPVSQARGVILMTMAKKRLPIHEFTPLQMKMIIAGYGRAEKKQVQEMIKELLALKEIPRPDDAADALGIAICCALKVTNYNPQKHKNPGLGEGVDPVVVRQPADHYGVDKKKQINKNKATINEKVENFSKK